MESGTLNKIALVTGAASGIGASVARALAEQGVVVAAVDRNAIGLHDQVDKLTADGLRAVAFPADVTSSVQVEGMVDAVEERLGALSCLVNAAGVLRMGEVRDLTEEDWAATFAVNVTGVFLVSRAVTRRMISRRGGAVVTVASNAMNTPRTQMAAYCAAKAASAMFTKSLGLELARYNIRCNVVAPGSTDTPMLRGMWTDDSGPRATLEGNPAAYRVGIPLGRIASASDIAEAVLFLLSDHAAHITMHSLTVDGGASLGG